MKPRFYYMTLKNPAFWLVDIRIFPYSDRLFAKHIFARNLTGFDIEKPQQLIVWKYSLIKKKTTEKEHKIPISDMEKTLNSSFVELIEKKGKF